MFDDPPAGHAERYAGTPSPTPGLTPRSEQVMSPNRREQQIVRERSRSHEGGTPRRSASRTPGTPPPLAGDQFHDLPSGPALVPSTPTACVSERHHGESLSRAPMTPSVSHGGSRLSATIADVSANRDHIIEQLMNENTALRASRDQHAFETAQAMS
eukprot:5985183-Amphidinium_carterae.1